jgi:uncharacterized protein YcbK (DUF882 family)
VALHVSSSIEAPISVSPARAQATPSPEEGIGEWFKFNPVRKGGAIANLPDQGQLEGEISYATPEDLRFRNLSTRWRQIAPECYLYLYVCLLMKELRNRLKTAPLLACLCVLTLLTVIPARTAVTTLSPAPEYRLLLFHTHTGERLDIVYRRGDSYIPGALAQLDAYLRDHRTGAVYHYDPRVFDLLHDLSATLGQPNSEIDIVCGYRSPWSNEFLRTHGHGVAQHSLHMQAMAIDIRMPGINTSRLRDAALALHRGGVGYYEKSDFVHVDVGRVRRW